MNEISGNGMDAPKGMPPLYAEDMPKPPEGMNSAWVACKCHDIRLLRLAWVPSDRVLVLLCADCGQPNARIKVESKLKIVTLHPGAIH